MKKFWNWIRNDEGERVLRLEGPIDENNFWGDSVTPDSFREELEAEDGDVTVWICSPGGNVFAAAEIYTMLCEYKGHITVKIDSIAASAASVIAMAGDRVLMSPVAMLMIHDPMTIAMGNASDLEKAISTLAEVKESIINAYARKSGMSRNKIAKLMTDETWMNAKKAVEMGFADEILYSDKKTKTDEGADNEEEEVEAFGQTYSARAMGQRVLNRLLCSAEVTACADEKAVAAACEKENVESPEVGVEPAAEAENTDNVSDTADEKPTGNIAVENIADTEPPTVPVIGMNGKTADGAMPYELLINQLKFLK